LEGISGSISFEKFEVLIHGKNFIKKVLEHNLVIPNYKIFHQNFLRCHEEIKSDSKYAWGEKASYIPSLYKANEKWWGSAFCSADGQYSQVGDFDKMFSMQSLSKVVSYAFLHNHYQVTKGDGNYLHTFVGEEPSGLPFNAPIFDSKNRPHNPMVNAGAIMVCTLLVNEGKTIEDF